MQSFRTHEGDRCGELMVCKKRIMTKRDEDHKCRGGRAEIFDQHSAGLPVTLSLLQACGDETDDPSPVLVPELFLPE